MTKIISGFPGIGKSTLYNNTDLKVLDSDSSNFSWSRPGVRNKDFPQNYIDHIKENMGKVDIILVSSHDVVREALNDNNIDYYIVYPDIKLKDEYLKRYKERGNDDKFLSFIEKNWESFINAIEDENNATLIKLHSNEYLSDIIKLFKNIEGMGL
ncbi:AAA family ATPase [Bacillus phage AR9]|uniref:AAA family ATPase n=2 Tax=Bacillus phage PBS1 TaxID=10683 RepID=A0A172JI79_BPPB1|nr:AAA family ATPase [Bacillus phage AR9]YP_009664264.1 hypothetical protein FK780_gp062 [Bacillus phage PBS1]AMS01258.1 AAA family ATPase [Bacillus phage AR9]AST99884.1 hypothetical protein PBI_PBS1_62 [Bacillus phage PBS1]BDE75296.1 hypothetical protein [Bacillus phage PBS1]